MQESAVLEKTENGVDTEQIQRPIIDVGTVEKKKRGRPKGYKMSKETKEKISAANLGKKKNKRK